MKKKFCCFLCVISFLSGILFSQTEGYKEKYIALLQSEKMNEVSVLLNTWKKESPKDPELFIAYYNYHSWLAMTSEMAMGQMSNGEYGVYSKNTYDKKEVRLALKYLDEGISLYPRRLDMYFGRCQLLMNAKMYEELKDTIIHIFELSKKNDNKWLWANEEPIGVFDLSAEEILFRACEDYLQAFYPVQGQSKEVAGFLEEIVKSETTLYPKNAWGWNHYGKYETINENYDGALQKFRQALELDPGDYVIIGNMASCYELSGQYEKAIAFYEFLKEFKIDGLSSYADNAIERVTKAKN